MSKLKEISKMKRRDSLTNTKLNWELQDNLKSLLRAVEKKIWDDNMKQLLKISNHSKETLIQKRRKSLMITKEKSNY